MFLGLLSYQLFDPKHAVMCVQRQACRGAADRFTACRAYKKGLVEHVSTFLAAVKASLVKLGVDENRLHRIIEEVGTCLASMLLLLVGTVAGMCCAHIPEHLAAQ